MVERGCAKEVDMEQMSMQNLLKQAVCKALYQTFAIPIYMEEVPQKAKISCFCVTVKETKKQQLLGRRFWVDSCVCVEYRADIPKQQNVSDVAERLYDVLWFVEDTERFQGKNMTHQKTEYGLQFDVWYGYGLVWQEDDVLMGHLAYRGGTEFAEENNI